MSVFTVGVPLTTEATPTFFGWNAMVIPHPQTLIIALAPKELVLRLLTTLTTISELSRLALALTLSRVVMATTF